MAQLELTIRHEYSSPGAAQKAPLPGFVLDIALSCEAGITVLFGASGSGKTLTLDALAGFLKSAQGRIVLDNAILFDAASGLSLPPQRRHVGYVFQNYALFPHLTIEQNLAFGIQHLPVLERTRRIHEELDRFGIAAKAGRLPRELSGGEKQRASIARALICQPKLLLLDEPVRGLDYSLRADFYEILRQVRERHRIPILLVTHDAEEGFLLGDKMAVFEEGRIVQFDKPEEIFQRPAKPSVARLLGISNVFQGVMESLDPMTGVSRLRTPAFTLTLPYLPGRLRGDTVEFCIRREHVALLPTGALASGNGRENRIPVRLAEEVFTPTTARLWLEVAAARSGPRTASAAIECEVSRAAYQEMELAQQKDWLAELPSGAIHIFAGHLQT